MAFRNREAGNRAWSQPARVMETWRVFTIYSLHAHGGSMDLEFEEINLYNYIKIRKLGQERPTYNTKFNLVFEITEK